MKPGIHPEYHEINIVMTDGTEFKTRSCMGKAGDTLRLDIDPKSHPAWTGVQRIMDTGGQVAKFNKKFAGHGMQEGKSRRQPVACIRPLEHGAEFLPPGASGTPNRGPRGLGGPAHRAAPASTLLLQEVS